MIGGGLAAFSLVGLDGRVDRPSAIRLPGFGDLSFLATGADVGHHRRWHLGGQSANRREGGKATFPVAHHQFDDHSAVVGGAGVIALLVWLAVAALPDGRLHVAFLDVG